MTVGVFFKKMISELNCSNANKSVVYDTWSCKIIKTLRMSVSKRRLSSNKATLPNLPVHESDDDDLDDAASYSSGFGGISRRRSLGGRRRSSFGSHNSNRNPVSAAEQTRIADMYITVIKMSTENVSIYYLFV